MPKGKSLLVIPPEFIEQVVDVITDESEEGSKKLVGIVQEAQNKYKGPVASWITGWVAQYTRTRIGEVQHSIDMMEQSKNYYSRLQEFRTLITKGEWNVGSYNVFLFLELVKTIPGYEPLSDDQTLLFVEKFKELLIPRVNTLIAEFEIEQRAKEARARDMEAMQRAAEQRSGTIAIFNNLINAQAAAKDSEGKSVFCLTYENSWKLFLVDVTGKAFALDLTEELSLELNKLTAKGFKDAQLLKPVHLNPLKAECKKAKELFLARLQLLVNPEDSNLELKAKGICSAFMLRQGNVWWINSLGDANKIALNDYPQLNAWIQAHNEPVKNAADTAQLKLHLLSVKTSQPVNAKKVTQLESLLGKAFNKNTIKPEVKPLAAHRYNCLSALPMFGKQNVQEPQKSEEEKAELQDYSLIPDWF